LKDDHLRVKFDTKNKNESLKRPGWHVKQHVAPLQANEVSIIRRKCTNFDVSENKRIIELN